MKLFDYSKRLSYSVCVTLVFCSYGLAMAGQHRKSSGVKVESTFNAQKVAATSSVRTPRLPGQGITSITVNSTDDANADDSTSSPLAESGTVTTLRSAIEYINAVSGVDTIFVPAGNYLLSLGQLYVGAGVVIKGSGAQKTIIDGGGSNRVLDLAGDVSVVDLEVTNGYAASASGGGILIANGGITVELDSIDVVGNKADQRGGGIEAGGGTLKMNYCRVDSNISDFKGGGYSYTPHYNGGGIHNSGAGITLKYCTFTGDSTVAGNGDYGGGISNDGGSITVDHCVFKHNYGDNESGAIDIESGYNLISNCILDSNNSAYNAGAMETGLDTLVMKNDTVRGNSCGSGGGSAGGGALILNDNYDTLSNVDVCGNKSGAAGGGIYFESSRGYFSNVSIDSNTASTSGGGVYDRYGGLTWFGGSLSYNTAASEGGGLYFNGTTNDTLYHVTMGNNSPDSIYNNTGGSNQVVFLTEGATLRNSSSAANTAATLNGFIVPADTALTVEFQYGTTSGVYTNSASASPSTVSGYTPTGVSAALTGLTPATVYYYRLIATMSSPADTFFTGEKSFTTTFSSFTNLKFSEDFEGGAVPPSGWRASSTTTSGYVWQVADFSAYGTGNYSAEFDCYDDNTSPDFDSLITPVITGLQGGDFLKFDYAYSGYPGSSDSLIVAVSTDGGATFTRLWYDGAPGLETTAEDQNAFSPTSSEWGTKSIALPAGVAGSNVVLSFICENGYGNNMYIDNIEAGTPSDVSLAVQATDFLAESSAGSVTLSWKTQSEVNNAGFDVLREDPGTSGFKLIASYTGSDSLRGLGTSTTGRNYDFTDNTVVPGDTYQYRIESVSTDGTTKDLSTLTLTVDVPKTYALYQNYPNPFNPSTTIRFDLKEQSRVTLDIYNVLGQRVEDRNYGMMDAGRYDKEINMAAFASGVYFYRIVARGIKGDKFVSIKKMLMLK